MSEGLLKIWKVLTAALLALAISSCAAQGSIRIGFVAGITGPRAALGVDGRDGALLAADAINAKGGINGRTIELVVRDDLGTSAGALAADKELIEGEGLFLVIGHMTSDTMMSAWGAYKDSGVVFLSPTVSTPQLQGMDDNFFRLIVVNSFSASRLAQYAQEELGLQKAAVLYDTDNAAFTETYQVEFSKAFADAGGEIVFRQSFSSKSAPDFRRHLHEVKEQGADSLFVAASAFDAALIAQQARLTGLNVRLLATNWALTEDLIKNGGEAVESVLAVVSHDENNQSPRYLDFQKRFVERYSRQPTFAAGYGYEAVMIAADALKKTNGSREGLKTALLETEGFSGVHGEISFDPYGDVLRTLYLISVVDGEFKTVKSFDWR